MKKTIVFLLVMAIALSLIACKDEPPAEEQPQFRETTITIFEGEDSCTAKVQGTLLNAQWNGTPNTIASAFTNAYTGATAPQKGTVYAVFKNNDVVIIAENATDYSIYKTVSGEAKKLYVNINGLSSLQSKVVEAVGKIGTDAKE